jgi:hypothetical protein
MASKLLRLNADRMPSPRLSTTTGVTPQSSRAPERNAVCLVRLPSSSLRAPGPSIGKRRASVTGSLSSKSPLES